MNVVACRVVINQSAFLDRPRRVRCWAGGAFPVGRMMAIKPYMTVHGTKSDHLKPRIGNSCYIKGKSAIHLARTYGGRRRNFVGQHFWARGCFVSTVGRDEAVVRAYIKNQEQEDKRLEQLEMFNGS
jgi:hypothetical protein